MERDFPGRIAMSVVLPDSASEAGGEQGIVHPLIPNRWGQSSSSSSPTTWAFTSIFPT